MVIVTEGLNFYFYFFSINVNVNSYMKLLTTTLDCTITGHSDVLCKSEDLSGHPYLYV